MHLTFHLFAFISCCLIERLVESRFIFPPCVLDTPQKCNQDSVHLKWPNTAMRFLLYTRKNQKEPERLHICNGTLPKESRFNPNNRLIVIIPGFMSGSCEDESTPMKEIKDELLEKGDVNVILIITADEYGTDFLAAMHNTKKAAKITIQVLKTIQAKTGFKNENVYLIGHSLGAHVAGLVGQQFPVHRITALDPAGVMYTKDTPLDKRLDPDDAEIVDVIHTNGGTGLPYNGAYFPMGDADIYVNGGTIQPNCGETVWNAMKDFDILYGIGMSWVPSLCAHAKSVEYYKNSINSNEKFKAYSCKSYKKFKSGNCTGDGASTVNMGFDFEESFTPEQRRRIFPRKYYIDTENS